MVRFYTNMVLLSLTKAPGMYMLAGLSVGLAFAHVPSAKETGDWFMAVFHVVVGVVVYGYALYCDAVRTAAVAAVCYVMGMDAQQEEKP